MTYYTIQLVGRKCYRDLYETILPEELVITMMKTIKIILEALFR